MIEIPENPNKRDFEAEVAQAAGWVIEDLKNGRTGELALNHSTCEHWVFNDVAAEVASIFKAKGYFAHYGYSIKGIAYGLYITKTPTNRDI